MYATYASRCWWHLQTRIKPATPSTGGQYITNWATEVNECAIFSRYMVVAKYGTFLKWDPAAPTNYAVSMQVPQNVFSEVPFLLLEPICAHMQMVDMQFVLRPRHAYMYA